jgi:hypothetical protein
MLFINGSLPTISIWRFYNDSVDNYIFNTHNKKYIKENRLDLISDDAKYKIIDNYINEIFESEYKNQLLSMEVNTLYEKHNLRRFLLNQNKNRYIRS